MGVGLRCVVDVPMEEIELLDRNEPVERLARDKLLRYNGTTGLVVGHNGAHSHNKGTVTKYRVRCDDMPADDDYYEELMLPPTSLRGVTGGYLTAVVR